MTQAVAALFDKLWNQYVEVTPSAERIHRLLASDSELINDHIALRTFDLERVNLDKLARHFTSLGYSECGEYQFVEKNLHAKHFEHTDPTLPKVFISELIVSRFSPWLQQQVEQLVSQLQPERVASADILVAGRCWQLSYSNYQRMQQESEYAAWMAAWGFRANHFTVSINHLKQFETIQQVNNTLKQHGFALNSAGGEIKGTPATLLEQSSTLADQARVNFLEGPHTIPGCFYEFALRYPTPEGPLFSGFVPASANKIFESTDTH